MAEELIYLAEDYMMYRESRQLDRWETRFARLSAEVGSLRPHGRVQQQSNRTLKAQAKQLQALSVKLREAEEQGRRRVAELLHGDLQLRYSRLCGKASDAVDAMRSAIPKGFKFLRPDIPIYQ